MQLPEPNQGLVVPAVSSSYPTLGESYRHGGYEIRHANQIARTGKDYYISKAGIAEGQRMSMAGEELVTQLALERAGINPRNAGVFDDLFSGWPDKVNVRQWTETFLRIPSGKQNPARPDYTDTQGRKYWAREVGNENEVAGEILVPEGGGRLVAEWDEVFGVPQVTAENQDWPHEPYTTHFWFNPTPDMDSTSGHYDVAVGRRGSWLHGVRGRCFHVFANYRRLAADSGDGFRPVRGSVPKIENI